MVYPPKVWEKVTGVSPRAGPDSASVGRAASFECGCFLEYALALDDEVDSTTFRTNGCAYMIASAAVLADALAGRRLSELHGLDSESLITIIQNELGSLPSERRQCADVCIEALHAAFQEHRSRQIEEFRGEKALICTCFGVTEETIDDIISANKPQSVEEVTAACRAGGGCGSCRMLIQEMLDGSVAYDVSAK